MGDSSTKVQTSPKGQGQIAPPCSLFQLGARTALCQEVLYKACYQTANVSISGDVFLGNFGYSCDYPAFQVQTDSSFYSGQIWSQYSFSDSLIMMDLLDLLPLLFLVLVDGSALISTFAIVFLNVPSSSISSSLSSNPKMLSCAKLNLLSILSLVESFFLWVRSISMTLMKKQKQRTILRSLKTSIGKASSWAVGQATLIQIIYIWVQLLDNRNQSVLVLWGSMDNQSGNLAWCLSETVFINPVDSV